MLQLWFVRCYAPVSCRKNSSAVHRHTPRSAFFVHAEHESRRLVGVESAVSARRLSFESSIDTGSRLDSICVAIAAACVSVAFWSNARWESMNASETDLKFSVAVGTKSGRSLGQTPDGALW